MKRGRTPTFRLLAGLAITLSAVAVYSAYTVYQLRALERLQTTTIDRNRTDSLLLLRIQKDLNDVERDLRDMLDQTDGYPLTAFRAPLATIRSDLADAMEKEAKSSTGSSENFVYLAGRMNEFWTSLDSVFALAEGGHADKADEMMRVSIQARQESLSNAVSRLLVQNNDSEDRAAEDIRAIYQRSERNVYVFLAAVLIVVVLTSIYLFVYNRNMFDHVEELSDLRSELAQQLITTQENTFRSLSRELHDDFGQILTAIGVMLQRADRKSGDLLEIREIVQTTLEKVRSLSHALHPVVLDEVGLEGALDVYLPEFEKQTGIEVRYEKTGEGRELDRELSIHLYRVTQEALNNVARHSNSKSAAVRLRFLREAVVLEVQDEGIGFQGQHNGVGFPGRRTHGLGLVSMRERAGLVNGAIEFAGGETGGALVRVTVPTAGGTHART